MIMKSNKPVRLEKKESFREKFDRTFMNVYPYLMFTCILLLVILLLILVIMYFPATESGQYYNRLEEVTKCLLFMRHGI